MFDCGLKEYKKPPPPPPPAGQSLKKVLTNMTEYVSFITLFTSLQACKTAAKTVIVKELVIASSLVGQTTNITLVKLQIFLKKINPLIFCLTMGIKSHMHYMTLPLYWPIRYLTLWSIRTM